MPPPVGSRVATAVAAVSVSASGDTPFAAGGGLRDHSETRADVGLGLRSHSLLASTPSATAHGPNIA